MKRLVMQYLCDICGQKCTDASLQRNRASRCFRSYDFCEACWDQIDHELQWSDLPRGLWPSAVTPLSLVESEAK